MVPLKGPQNDICNHLGPCGRVRGSFCKVLGFRLLLKHREGYGLSKLAYHAGKPMNGLTTQTPVVRTVAEGGLSTYVVLGC